MVEKVSGTKCCLVPDTLIQTKKRCQEPIQEGIHIWFLAPLFLFTSSEGKEEKIEMPQTPPILRSMFSLLSMALCASLAATGEASINVGVIADQSGVSSAVDLAAQLSDDTWFDFSTTVLNSASADTASELAGYDVLVLGGSGFTQGSYSAACLAAVRTFLSAGGGVVTTGWYNFGAISQAGQGDLDADFVTPIQTTNANHFDIGPGTVNVISNIHPITSGLANFNYSGADIELELAADSGAVVLGTVAGSPHSGVAIAYQDVVGRSVYLGGLYMAHPTYGITGLRTGVEDRLIEQATQWAAGIDEAQVVPEPLSWLVWGGLAGITSVRLMRRSSLRGMPEALGTPL